MKRSLEEFPLFLVEFWAFHLGFHGHFLFGKSSRVMFFPTISEVLGAARMANICVVFKEVISIGRMTSPKRHKRTSCKMRKESKLPLRGLGEGRDGGMEEGWFFIHFCVCVCVCVFFSPHIFLGTIY